MLYPCSCHANHVLNLMFVVFSCLFTLIYTNLHLHPPLLSILERTLDSAMDAADCFKGPTKYGKELPEKLFVLWENVVEGSRVFRSWLCYGYHSVSPCSTSDMLSLPVLMLRMSLYLLAPSPLPFSLWCVLFLALTYIFKTPSELPEVHIKGWAL